MPDQSTSPDRFYPCHNPNCNRQLVRGYGDVTCDCGAEYNSFGQRLRSDWRNNLSNYDGEIGDLEGFEAAHADDN